MVVTNAIASAPVYFDKEVFSKTFDVGVRLTSFPATLWEQIRYLHMYLCLMMYSNFEINIYFWSCNIFYNVD